MKKNNKQITITVCICVLLALALSLVWGCAAPAATPSPTPKPTSTPTPSPTSSPTVPPGEEYQWKLFTPYGDAVFCIPLYRQMMTELEEETNGRLKVDIYVPGEHPYYGVELADALRNRECEMIEFMPTYLGGVHPATSAKNIPLWCKNREMALEAHPLFSEKIFKPLFAEYANMEEICWFQFPPDVLVTKDFKLEDFDSARGKRLRIKNIEQGNFCNLINAEGTYMDWPEVFSAFQTGILDGMPMSVSTSYHGKFFETINYICANPIDYAGGGIQANMAAMQELPEEIREIVYAKGREYTAIINSGYHADNTDCIERAALEYGVTYYPMPSEMYDEIMSNVREIVWEPWIERAGDYGVIAFDIIDSILSAHS